MSEEQTPPKPTFIVRASQDAKRAIKYDINDPEGTFVIFNIEKSINIEVKFSIIDDRIDDLPKEQIAECVFFPSAFGYIIAIAYKTGELRFIKEETDDTYTLIKYQVGCPDNDISSSIKLDTDTDKKELVFPYFEKNLRVSLFPPELNIGFISKDTICIFFVDFQTTLIKLIPIRRYYTPNTVWFDFTNDYSIWKCIINQNRLILEKFDLNSFKSKTEKTYESTFAIDEFVDASISPMQFGGIERIAILKKNISKSSNQSDSKENPSENNKVTVIIYNNINSNNNTSNDSQNKPKTYELEVLEPMSIEWSPFGSRIAIFSAIQDPKIIIETSYNTWKAGGIFIRNDK